VSNGVFVTFEGINGAGKSTQLHRVANALLEAGYDVEITREPGGTPAAEAIRTILLSPSPDPLTPTSEVLLFVAARKQHVERKIKPALERGAIVLCDRYSASSVAFQCHGHGFPVAKFLELEHLALGDFVPDHCVVLDLDPREGLARNAALGEVDAIEHRSLEYHDRVREGFLAQAHERPDRFTVVDASQPPDEVFQAVLDVVTACLDKTSQERFSHAQAAD